MSKKGFTPLFELLKSGGSTAEIVDRIELGDLHWRDDFGRHVPAGKVENECVIESLRVYQEMLKDPIKYDGVQITEYWNQWSILDNPLMAHHPLVRGGFLDASTCVLPKPLPKATGDYISTKLATLNQAATKFWANADRNDRTTHESNAAVVAWLVEKGYSESLAEKGATIIRPEWAPTGRKPEK